MKQHKVLIYISISMLTLCAVVLAGALSYNRENANAEETSLETNTLYTIDSSNNTTATSWTSGTQSTVYTTLSGAYTVYDPDGNLLFTSQYIGLNAGQFSSGQRNILYILCNDTNNQTSTKYIRFDFIKYSDNTLLYQCNYYSRATTSDNYTSTGAQSYRITFSTFSAGNSTYNTQINYFKQDITKVLTKYVDTTTIIHAGYYIINPNYYSDFASYSTLNTQFRLYQVETDSDITTPLSVSGQVQVYNTIEASQGLYNGIYARYENDITPTVLYNATNDVVNAYIIQILNDTTTNNTAFENLLMPVAGWDVLPYWAYTLANDYYDKGINTNILSDSTTGVISALFGGLFGSIFAVEIFPGFPLYIFILIPVVFAILSLVLWLMRGR